jgi:D-glycero-D-manno-heptose 1,7-bisphosphate phosphatase
VKRAVFLDRDGVLVREIVRDGDAFAPTRVEDFALVEEAAEQVDRLRAAGLLCIVFTNQPEVARGLLAPEVLEQMHQALRSSVAVDDIVVCPHVDADGCDCRKPSPGMLRQAAEQWEVDLERSFVVGDRWRDIDAGRAAGCYTVLLERAYSKCTTADACVSTLPEAVDLILARA